jgi:predicted RNase H-like nuclease (RuvC/YqgF family)
MKMENKKIEIMNKRDQKLKILEAGMARQKELIHSFEKRIDELRKSGKHLNDTQYDAQQASFNDETNEIIDLLTGQLNFVVDEMNVMRTLTNELVQSIKMGAVVVTDRMKFFVSVSLEEFEVDGENYFGISAKAPIYDKMRGLYAGDSFEMNGAKYQIKEVF